MNRTTASSADDTLIEVFEQVDAGLVCCGATTAAHTVH